jgi:hypothetical protein
MNKELTVYFNYDVIGDNTCEQLDEFNAYITSLFYSLVVLFDGLSLDRKQNLDKDTYVWKLHINDKIDLEAKLTTSMSSNYAVMVEVLWEIQCSPIVEETYAAVIENIIQVLKRECINMKTFFIHRRYCIV